MTRGHVFIAASLDGFIARRDGGIDWLNLAAAEGEDHGYDRFMAGMDGLVMGRNTYETARSFGAWPYKKPVVVLSRVLEGHAVPRDIADRVRFWDCGPRDAMQRLEAEGWANAYVDGGRVIQAFLRAGLIGEMIVTRIPVLLGEGIPLFGPTNGDIALAHLRTRAFGSGLVQSHYRLWG